MGREDTGDSQGSHRWRQQLLTATEEEDRKDLFKAASPPPRGKIKPFFIFWSTLNTINTTNSSCLPRPDFALGDSADVLRTPQAPSAKRARTHDGDTSFYSSVLSIPGRIYDWMTTKVNIFSGGRRGPAPTPTTDEDVSSDDTDGGGAVDAESDQPIDMSRRRREEPVQEDPPLLDLTRDDPDEKDEVL